MANKSRPALGNIMPAGMECGSDSDDDDFDYSKTNVQTGGNNQRNDSDPVHRETFNNLQPQASNGEIQERTLFKNDDDHDSSEGNPDHWRKFRMHQSLPMPFISDEYRMAVMQGNLELVKSVIEQGIPVDTKLKSGWTGLMYSCSHGYPEMTRYFLEKKADVHYHKDRFDSLMAACASKQKEEHLLECVKALAEYGCNVNTMEKHHVTPLAFAAREGNSTIVKFLIEKGADVDICDNRGWTALTWAISKGQGDVVRILLESNASVANIKSSGQSMVELAHQCQYESIAHLIETFGTSKTVPDVDLTNQPKSAAYGFEPFKEKNRFKAMECGDLEIFLSGLALSHLIPLFHQHELNFQQFLRLTDENLSHIGVDKLGARIKILEGIRDVHRMDWEETSLKSLDPHSISCPDAVSMVANINKHLCYIQSTIGYLRDQIQAKPRILELGQEVHSVRTLLQGLEGAIKNNKNLLEELRFFKLHLDKVQDNVDYMPADVIVERRSSESDVEIRRQRQYWRFGAVIAIVGVAMISTGAWRTRMVTWSL